MFADKIFIAETGRKNYFIAGTYTTIAFFAFLFLCLMPSVASAQTVQYTNSTSGAIPNSTASCPALLTRTFTVASGAAISDVNIGLLVTHDGRNEITATLQSPSGTIITLIPNNLANNKNVNTLFDDSAAASITANLTDDTITAVPPYQKTYQPSIALSNFNGQSPIGTWVFTICDFKGAKTGTFNRADLYITTVPASYADLSLTKTVSNATPAFADTITYTLALTNASGSPTTATGVTVRDTLPAGVSFVSSSGSGSYNSGTGIWTVGTLAPGATATLNIIVTVSATSGNTVTNVAEVTASSVADIDSTPNNGITIEDDYASRAFTVSATRIPGTPPTLVCPVGTTVFDWDGRTWATGSLNNSYTLTNVGIFNIGISSSIPFVAGSPTLNGNLTGGLSPVQNSLFLNMNNTLLAHTSTAVIALPTAVPAMQFRLHDVDFGAGSFADKVTVMGSFNGNAVFPTLTNGVSNYVSGNVAIGDAGAGDTTAIGNVVVTFASPVDTVTVIYGNHTTAPADPGNQWMSIHDISFCNPQANLSVTKTSTVLSDGISASNPKAVPGATVRYCITVTNNGSGTATSVSASDIVPVRVTYIPGSMTTGATCAAASTAEDDNNSGADESDPFGMSIAGTTITGSAASLAPNASVALVFRATVN